MLHTQTETDRETNCTPMADGTLFVSLSSNKQYDWRSSPYLAHSCNYGHLTLPQNSSVSI